MSTAIDPEIRDLHHLVRDLGDIPTVPAGRPNRAGPFVQEHGSAEASPAPSRAASQRKTLQRGNSLRN